ncbi:MAG: hypothetical protein LBF69_00990 [Prevotellaceae bacterium]|jgi:hypothetical protein|nr:hypothetical protein [Prevotellaceae bacterium]
MATAKIKEPIKTTAKSKTVKEKLSKAAQWMLANPDRSKDVIIYDKSILYN